MDPQSPETQALHVDAAKTAAGHCPNCEANLVGPYCYQCGQAQQGLKQILWVLLGEILVEIFEKNSQLRKTLFTLLFKPGRISRDYFLGRRARYIGPIRLYLVSSVIFFFSLSFQGSIETINIDTGEQASGSELNIAGQVDVKPTNTPAEPEDDFFIDEMDLGILDTATNLRLRDYLNEKLKKAAEILKREPDRLVDLALDIAPPVMFCLLPLFALLLKLTYLKNYYVEHLVFAVHNHTFLYFLLAIEAQIESLSTVSPLFVPLDILISIWLPIYLLLSLKYVYQDGWFICLVKFGLLSMSYLTLFFFAVVSALVIGLLSL